MLSSENNDLLTLIEPGAIIFGDNDDITPCLYSNNLTDKFPGAHQDIIPEADHFVPLKRYQQVNVKIEEFLQGLK